MKPKLIKCLTMFAVVISLALAGCSSDDNGDGNGGNGGNDDDTPSATCNDGIQNGNEEGIDCGGSCPTQCTTGEDPEEEDPELSGAISEDRTLDSSITYQLTGALSVESGATLTIPAGTLIIANGEPTSSYIVVNKGADIQINGTEADPVIMRSANQDRGDWGGLIILGDATTSEGVDAESEVGGFIYGGTNDTDNSGSINYLIINHSGAQIDADSGFNGLSLYAVGSGTTISNVAILNSLDDGVAFFGGTVSPSNFYLVNNEDDAVDWTEGWNGTLTTTFVNHTDDGFSTAVEADGVDAAIAVPTLVDFTAFSVFGGTALQFKETTGAVITNIYLLGYDTNVEMTDGGPVGNISVDGTALTTVDDDVFDGDPVPQTMFDWANQ